MGAGSSPWKDLHGILPQESNGSIFPDNSSVASLSQSQSLARGLSHIPSEEISRMNIMEPVPVGHEKTATRAYRTIQRNATINMKGRDPAGSENALHCAQMYPEQRSKAQVHALAQNILRVRKLAHISNQDAEVIAQNATLVDYKPGEIIFVQGDMPVHLFIVLKGAVDIFIRHEDTRDMGTSPEPIRRTFVSYQKAIKLFGRRVTTIEKQHLFGELALIKNCARTATAVSARDTYVLQLATDIFHKTLAWSLSRSMLQSSEQLVPFPCMEMLHKDSLRALCYCFETVEFQPRQKLLVQGIIGTHEDQQIFFLAAGRVMEYIDPLFDPDQNPGHVPSARVDQLLGLAQVQPGSILGDSCLVTDRIATTCVAVDLVKAYKICRSDLTKRLPNDAMEYMCSVAILKLESMQSKLSKVEQEGRKIAKEGVIHIRPGEYINGKTGGHIDHTHRTGKQGLLLFQATHVMHGRALRRLGEVQDEETRLAAMAQREARKAKTRPTSPDILWHYEPPINLKMYSKEYVKALTRDGNLDAFLDSQGHSPLRNSINLPVVHKGSSLRAASKLRLTVPTPYALPIQSPMPSGETLPGQELAEAILSPLKPTGNGDPPEGSQQEDEAPDRPYEPFANPSNTSGSTPNHHSAATRGSLIDLGRLAKKAEPLGATLAAEELGLEQLMAAELAVPYVKASEVGMMRPEDVRGLWDQLVPLAGIDVHDPGGRARGAGASNISLPVRSPSHSPRGSPRVSPSRSSPIRTLWDSYGGVRTSAAREPRDDILDAVELGIPLCALAGRKPLELLTVLRPKTTTVNSRSSSKAPPPGRTNSRPSTLRSHKQPPLVCDPIMTTEELGHGSESLSRLAAAGRASMLGAPSGLLSSPSSRGPTPRTRRPDMTAALQADRQVRVQAPEGTALTDAQARDLLQQAEDEHAERGSLNTFYASHFKPRALVWTLDSSLRHTARVSDPPGSGDQAGIKAKPPSTTAMLARSRASLGRRFNY